MVFISDGGHRSSIFIGMTMFYRRVRWLSGRTLGSRSREYRFESPLLLFRSSLSCINEYASEDSGGNMSE